MLALDGKHLAFLGRNGSHPTLGTLFAALCVVALHVDADNHIVDGTDDALLHGVQRVVQFFHYGVLVAAVADQPVAFQLGGIVGRDLGLNVHVADACIGRDQVCFFLGVGEIFLDIPGQTQLGFQFQSVSIVFLRFTHVHAGRGSNVYHLIVALEGFQV